MAGGLHLNGAQEINWVEKYIEKLGRDYESIMNAMSGLETRLNNKIENLENKMDQRIENLENKMDQRIENLENKMDQKIENLENKMDQRMDRIEARMDSTEKHVRNFSYTLLVGMIATLLAVGGLVFSAITLMMAIVKQ
ncbi:MAG: apolipoprotein A1/A4/E family protein [Selenomonadaceae bacterium]|nr:apolipoprotein A1/A4/E family protein [Selenomonadaceae bacterium]